MVSRSHVRSVSPQHAPKGSGIPREDGGALVLGSSSYIPAERRCAGVAAPAADPLLASVRPAQRQSNILTNTD